MKTYLLNLALLGLALVTGTVSFSQSGLAPDQNPSYAVSRDKYMKMADSLTRWQSTTFQDTYKAIDWLADRREARAERRGFRQQLRLERARWVNDYYDNYNYFPGYRGRWGNYRNSYYNGFNRRSNSFFLNPWGVGYWWR